MQIRIQNTIRFGEEMEIVDQYYQGEWKEKAGFQYLLYTNEEDEKVALKFSNDELIMTRFSTPKSIMRFSAKVPALVHIPTPLGTQHFLTDTSLFAHDPNGQTVDVHYQLKHPETEDVFADYELEVSWF